MTTRIYWAQMWVLLVGTVFSWTTVAVDFVRFYSNEGTLFKIKDCVYPNPVTTPCFYGAIAFAVALATSVFILNKEAGLRQKIEKRLFALLAAGTVFAWSNFGILMYKFYTALPGQGVGCSGVPASSPFFTPCFYGSALFLIALIVSVILLMRERGALVND